MAKKNSATLPNYIAATKRAAKEIDRSAHYLVADPPEFRSILEKCRDDLLAAAQADGNPFVVDYVPRFFEKILLHSVHIEKELAHWQKKLPHIDMKDSGDVVRSLVQNGMWLRILLKHLRN